MKRESGGEEKRRERTERGGMREEGRWHEKEERETRGRGGLKERD